MYRSAVSLLERTRALRQSVAGLGRLSEDVPLVRGGALVGPRIVFLGHLLIQLDGDEWVILRAANRPTLLFDHYTSICKLNK